MRFKGKKVIVSYWDTYDLNHTLNPIICASLKKFLEVIKDEKFSGVPSDVLKELGYESSNLTDEQLHIGSQLWHSYIEKMIYTFEDQEPCISDYDFEFGPIEENLPVSNQQEYDRYNRDLETHAKKVQKGLDLFAKYYKSLWW